MNSILFFLQDTRRYSPAFLLHNCAHDVQRVCLLLTDVFLAFHTGVAGLGVISGSCHISCWQFEPLEELGCVSLFLFGCPSQRLQQLLMLLEGTILSWYEVSPAHNAAAPVKSSFDSVFHCYSPCLFCSILQSHWRRSQWCWRKWQGANEQSCFGCMWLWPCPGYEPLPLSCCSPRPFVVFCFLWCSEQHLCAHQQDIFPFLGAIRDDAGSVSEGKHWKCYLPVLHCKKLRGRLQLVFSHCPQHGNLPF